MSTIVPMPERVKPPPADTGEIISPGCASFEIATPSNGARTVMSARSVRCWLTRLSDTLTCCWESEIRALMDSTSARAESSSALPMILLLDELLPAAKGQLRFAQPGLVLGRAAPRGLELRFGDRERRPHLRVVEPREHLPFPDRLAFLDEHFEDLAGHLRRHGRAAPGRHVAGSVQAPRRGQRRPRSARSRLRSSRAPHRPASSRASRRPRPQPRRARAQSRPRGGFRPRARSVRYGVKRGRP